MIHGSKHLGHALLISQAHLQRSAHVGCWCYRLWLNALCHNACPSRCSFQMSWDHHLLLFISWKRNLIFWSWMSLETHMLLLHPVGNLEITSRYSLWKCWYILDKWFIVKFGAERPRLNPDIVSYQQCDLSLLVHKNRMLSLLYNCFLCLSF